MNKERDEGGGQHNRQENREGCRRNCMFRPKINPEERQKKKREGKGYAFLHERKKVQRKQRRKCNNGENEKIY